MFIHLINVTYIYFIISNSDKVMPHLVTGCFSLECIRTVNSHIISLTLIVTVIAINFNCNSRNSAAHPLAAM